MSPPSPIPVSATAGFPRRRLHGTPGWRVLLAGLALIAAVAAAAAIDTMPGGSARGDRAGAQAMAEARAFLRRYVTPSGQVLRRDQGNTTVSEGQAYALLLADAAGQTETFRRVWRWTASHLQRPDGELAYLTDPSGRVLSSMPAADADVLSAWALARYQGPEAGRFHAQARRISQAILSNETVRRGNLLLLAAGPWATGSPASLNPSYWAPQAFADLAGFTGDRRWTELAASTRQVTRSLTGDGRLLPPDWARVDGTHVSATPAPGGGVSQVQYGLNAQRLTVWLAHSCQPADRRLAARWWRTLDRGGAQQTAVALAPDGTVLQGQSNALPEVAAAAAAGAAGDTAARGRLLAGARRTQHTYPTYYGGAWLALGEILLQTNRLGGCGTEGGI